MRDVIVVGAGPCGSTVAMALAERGHDVLLLDRSAFPRDKCCGDGVVMEILDLVAEFGLETVIRQAGFHSVEGMRFVSPKGRALELMRPGSGFIAPRADLDALFWRQAQKSGAEFAQARVMGPLFEGGQVVGVQALVDGQARDIRARLVIGADGVNSVMARILQGWNGRRQHLGVALRGYIEGLAVQPGIMEFHMRRIQRGFGYQWLFPMGPGRANLGCGMNLEAYQRLGQKPEQVLMEFLESSALSSRLSSGYRIKNLKVGLLPFCISSQIERVFDGALLVGDAGAFVNPFDGGGLLFGILSARLAARVAHQTLKVGDTSLPNLRLYEKLIRRHLLCHCRVLSWGHKILARSPGLIEWVLGRGARNPRFLYRFFDYNYRVKGALADCRLDEGDVLS